MIPNNAIKEKKNGDENNNQDRRKVKESNKQFITDKLAEVETAVANSTADQDLKDAILALKEAVRESEHIQTGDNRFDPNTQ